MVEVAINADRMVAVGQPDGPTLVVTGDAWNAFLADLDAITQRLVNGRWWDMITSTDAELRRQARANVPDDELVLPLADVVFKSQKFKHAQPDLVDLLMDCDPGEIPGEMDPETLLDQFDRLLWTLAGAPAGMAFRGRLAAALGLRPGTRVPEWTSDPAAEQLPGVDGGGVLPAPELGFVELHETRILLVLLGSDIDSIRRRAIDRLSKGTLVMASDTHRTAMAPMLRAVRRSRMPTRARRAALEMLTEIGWHELDPVDQVVLRRLAGITSRAGEVPEPVDMDTNWFAVPTSDQAAVLDALGLVEPVPVPLRAGFAANYWCQQVFVTPVLDGWTLVVDHPLLYEPVEEAHRLCAELSRRFGAAHWYSHCQGHSGWCVAEAGAIQAHCYYSPHDDASPRTGPIDAATGRPPTVEELTTWVAAHDSGAGHAPPLPPPVSPQQRAEIDAAYNQSERDLQRRLSISLSETIPPRSRNPSRHWMIQTIRPRTEGTTPGTTTTRRASCVPASRGPPAGTSKYSRSPGALSVLPESLGPHTRVAGRGVLAVPPHLRTQRRGNLPLA